MLPKTLHRAIRVLAAERDRTVKDVVTAALRAWVQRREEEEDLAAADAEATGEYVTLAEAEAAWTAQEPDRKE